MIEDKLEDHFKNFSDKEILSSTTILALSLEGQVLAQLGRKRNKNELQSLGALLVGMWQASEAVDEFFKNKEDPEMALSFKSTQHGFFILRPTINNPKTFWAFLFDEEKNPGKILAYAKKLRLHMDELSVGHHPKSSNENEEPLFENITEEEVDKLFSFAGI